MLQWPSLDPWKYSHVQQITHWPDIPFIVFQSKRIIEIFFHHNDSAPRAPKGFVGCRSYNMAVVKWRIKELFSNKSRRVGHITHDKGTDPVSNLTNTHIIPVPAICRCATDNEFGLLLFCHCFHAFI